MDTLIQTSTKTKYIVKGKRGQYYTGGGVYWSKKISDALLFNSPWEVNYLGDIGEIIPVNEERQMINTTKTYWAIADNAGFWMNEDGKFIRSFEKTLLFDDEEQANKTVRSGEKVVEVEVSFQVRES